MRAAASRTFWTAGRSRPMRIAMIAITTSSSISVKAAPVGRRRERRRVMGGLPKGERENDERVAMRVSVWCGPCQGKPERSPDRLIVLSSSAPRHEAGLEQVGQVAVLGQNPDAEPELAARVARHLPAEHHRPRLAVRRE